MKENAIFAQPLVRSRLHDEIVTIIQKRILTGALAPGTRLPPERELAETLKVNRATVREALRKLEYLELLDIRHGDGVYVSNFMESSNIDLIRAIVTMGGGDRVISDVLEVRRIVVPAMASLAAERRSDADVAELKRIIFHDGLTILEKDIKVHQIIARSAGNLLYTIILNFFNQLFQDYFYNYFENEQNTERSRAFHLDLFAAVRERQPGKAREVTLEVLEFAEMAIRKSMTKKS